MADRLAAPLIALALLAALLGGCGEDSSSSDTTSTSGGNSTTPAGTSTAPLGAAVKACDAVGEVESLRASGTSCAEAERVLGEWRRAGGCEPDSGASRFSCRVGSYRCLGARTERGLAVGCSRPGQAVGFILARD